MGRGGQLHSPDHLLSSPVAASRYYLLGPSFSFFLEILGICDILSVDLILSAIPPPLDNLTVSCLKVFQFQ